MLLRVASVSAYIELGQQSTPKYEGSGEDMKIQVRTCRISEGNVFQINPASV